ncbi:ORC2 [Candida jiufengensis]|uniref:ORC2 n=1 Tax=Candida jiufengensis TaxID=497108 RepID=UPI002224A35B|nr:ORC2 [Candida jiufengensis]KAI5952267.1 ORC2 [Candida jiufengensis]
MNSPFRSPLKKDSLLNLVLSPTKKTILSPVKTPNGRAGLRSPEKRSTSDLDHSARKRANSTLYNKLMDDEDDFDELLNEQDRLLAERIIKASKTEVKEEDEINYGSDVELEIDETTKRGRRIKRKASIVIADEENLSSGSEAEIHESDSDTEQPFKKRQPKQQSPTKASVYKTKNKRLNDVASNIKSIFLQDDEVFDQLAPNKNSKKNTNRSLISLLVSQHSVKQSPLISGLKKDKTKTHQQDITTFKPLSLDYGKQFLKELETTTNKQIKLSDQSSFSIDGAEGYFEQNHKRFRNNSSSVVVPQISKEELQNNIKLSLDILQPERNSLADLHNYLFNQWCFEMSQQFNLIMYGTGSKLNLINSFIPYFNEWCTSVYGEGVKTLVVNGYLQSLDIKLIVHQIASLLLGHDNYPKHLNELIEYLLKTMNERREEGEITPKLLLIIHNLDGPNLRKEISKISKLLSIEEIWAICSIDHINSTLLFDSSTLKSMNCLWHDLTTFDSYFTELSSIDMLAFKQHQMNTSGWIYVLQALTSNHKKCFILLIKKQMHILEPQNSDLAKGSLKNAIDLKEFYNQCLDEFIVSNDSTFKLFLKEFADHNMCVFNKNSIFIPLNYKVLNSILQSIE